LPINIPETLANKLKANSALYGAVLQSLAEFEPWLASSGTPFFPEYTDHGPRHISETLGTASSLVRDEAWPVVTPTDAGTLVLAILLHDSAMHLSEDGFVSLIGPKPADRRLKEWAETPWPDLWLDFLGEASRFDARKLTSLFGDTEPVKNPKPDPRDWTLRDRLLIGEFVRRHHARLAHETAVHGVPGPGSPRLRLQGVEPDLANLAGLVARSHGMPIRDVLPHLKEYDVREYKGIHPPFLMALVRVADYLQVHSDRAPTGMLRVRQLRSPSSQREWKAHAAIRDIRNTHDDPEAIFIDAAPEDVRTFLRLKQLLAGIQGELDASWAVLGEVYGRIKGLDQLGLNLRRVRSNIDEVAEFARTVPYLPYEAAFDAAGPELLKLLIGPLYGEHPEIGIRELLQNAVDACRELKDYLEETPSPPKPDLAEQSADVEIWLEDKGDAGRWVEVRDRGIGMSAETVRRYFLRAGASFRRSDAWRKIHETPEGKSRVLRSGRFGIGVLAAFLLGDEVEVSTRNVVAEAGSGIAFNATLDTEDIELRHCPRPVGTTIRVRVSGESVWKSLTGSPTAWDWYCPTRANGLTTDWPPETRRRTIAAVHAARPKR
jgi:molecular chaperone HtpG